MRASEVDKVMFDWQMELLRAYFNPLPLAVALELQKSGDLPPASVCVTFDDGYADNVDVALPILEKWDIPATFFISSGYLNGGRMWNDTVLESVKQIPAADIDLTEIDLGRCSLATENERLRVAYQILTALKHLPPDRRAEGTAFVASFASDLPIDLMMTSPQVKKLVDSGMEIGGHTVSHPILASLDCDEARREIVEGKKALEELSGGAVSYFAYPNGKSGQDFTHFHSSILPGIGFKAAVSTHWGVSTLESDIWQLPRFTPWDRTPAKFMLRMIRNYRNVQ